jgi:allantoinase
MKGGDDAFAVWGGISGVQSLVALTLTEGIDHALVSARPAERFRLPGKGRLEPGADADIVLVDDAEWELRPDDLRYRHRDSPYVGRRMHGRVVRAWLRGQPVGEQPGRLVKVS